MTSTPLNINTNLSQSSGSAGEMPLTPAGDVSMIPSDDLSLTPTGGYVLPPGSDLSMTSGMSSDLGSPSTPFSPITAFSQFNAGKMTISTTKIPL